MAVRVIAAAAYGVLVASLAWYGGSDEGGGTWPPFLLALALIAWASVSVLVGEMVGAPALAVALAAIVGVAVTGEILGEHDNEVRLLNWAIEAVYSVAFVSLGVWLSVRRNFRNAPRS
jgi:hypothetical protein